MASWEERRNIKSAILLSFLSIAAFAILYFIGIPLVGKFTAFLGDLRKSGSIDKSDITPPAPPRFNLTSDYTNQKNFTITGKAEVGATIKLIFNSKEIENITDKSGDFSFSIELKDGINTFSAKAIDTSGNESLNTNEFAINFDNVAPDLEITKPDDNSNLFGSAQRQVTIQGKTEENAQITINDRFVSVGDTGNYQYSTNLSEGENKFNIKSSDRAGNLTEKNLVVFFTP